MDSGEKRIFDIYQTNLHFNDSNFLSNFKNVLGVVPAKKAKLFVILSPVANYFEKGFVAVKIICSENNIRSWPGGFGNAKLGA